MRIKYFVFIFLYFFESGYCLPSYSRPFSPLEQSNFEAAQRSPAQNLVVDFAKLDRGGKIPSEVLLSLGIMAQSNIGKNLLCVIFAKLQSRIECLNSIVTVLDDIERSVACNFLQELLVINNQAATDEADFCQKINVISRDSFGFIDMVFRRIKKTPQLFFKKYDMNLHDESLYSDLQLIIGSLLRSIQKIHDLFLKDHFCFIFDPNDHDRYNPNDNTIIIANKNYCYNCITGPLLKSLTTNDVLCVETQWVEQSTDSTLFHELGHYLRMALEGTVSSTNFFNIITPLKDKALPPEYLDHLEHIWDNSEELTAICGIIYSDNQLTYDLFNQSAYNCQINNGRGLRYSHKDARFPLVPFSFVNLFGGTNILTYQYSVYYDKAIASI